jgi:hypothetical protein
MERNHLQPLEHLCGVGNDRRRYREQESNTLLSDKFLVVNGSVETYGIFQ